MTHNNFTIIGAGPYGMAAASHLASAGIELRIFGKPMDFWNSQMPKGMLLRSPWSGSSIGDPNGSFTLDRYEAALGKSLPRQLPLADFVRYGQWFQRQALPALDQRNVARLETSGSGYRVTLDDGEASYSASVVIATGIGSFAHRPAPFSCLPPELVSHTSDRPNRELGRFAGKRVAVIGAGQSAIESAALLYESGAEVEVLMRRPQLRWLTGRPLIEWLMHSKLYPFKAPGRIGPIGLDWLLEHPALFTLMPRGFQDKMAYRAIRPAASAWLRPRAGNIRLTGYVDVIATQDRGGKAHLKFAQGAGRSFDHVLLATGYKIDIARYNFLSTDLLKRMHAANGYPILNRGFESSLPGLYFLGAAAAYSFGPFFRFVAGTQYAATALSSHAVQRASHSRREIYCAGPTVAGAG